MQEAFALEVQEHVERSYLAHLVALPLRILECRNDGGVTWQSVSRVHGDGEVATFPVEVLHRVEEIAPSEDVGVVEDGPPDVRGSEAGRVLGGRQRTRGQGFACDRSLQNVDASVDQLPAGRDELADGSHNTKVRALRSFSSSRSRSMSRPRGAERAAIQAPIATATAPTAATARGTAAESQSISAPYRGATTRKRPPLRQRSRGAVTDALDALFAKDPDSIGPSEVAARLGVATRSVYTWLKEGTSPGYKIGSSWFVITAELKDTLRAGRHRAGSDGTALEE